LKEIKTKKGLIKYRLPNIVEGFEFLAMIDAIKTNSDFFKVKAKFIANLGSLLDYSDCGYKSYDELLLDKDNMMFPLSQISQEVFDDITGALAKKD
jgi:hypothetical protein